jgi:hypothetical protein
MFYMEDDHVPLILFSILSRHLYQIVRKFQNACLNSPTATSDLVGPYIGGLTMEWPGLSFRLIKEYFLLYRQCDPASSPRGTEGPSARNGGGPNFYKPQADNCPHSSAMLKKV